MRHATNASRAAGLMYDVAIRRAEQARASQRSSDASPNAVHIRLHPSASMPDGPAAPPVCTAARRIGMAVLSRLVNSTGWGCAGGCPWRSDAGESASAGGCLLRSNSRTVSSPMTSSRSSTPPL